MKQKEEFRSLSGYWMILSNQCQLFLKLVHLKVHSEVFFTDKMIFYILEIIFERVAEYK